MVPVRCSPPVLQWIGRHSYALYLWHWPVLVLADARWGPLNWIQRFVAVVIAVGLSALSFRFVEDPVRHARWLAAVPARSLAFGAAMVVVMLTAGWALSRSIPALDGGAGRRRPQLSRRRDARPTTVVTTVHDRPGRPAPHRAADDDGATTTDLPPLVAPDAPTGDLAALVASMQQVLDHRLQPGAGAVEPAPVARRGAESGAPVHQGLRERRRQRPRAAVRVRCTRRRRTILLYGDSHAVQWFEPLEHDRPASAATASC